MNQTIPIFFAILLLIHSSAFAQSKPRLKGIDLFGSDQINAQQIRSRFADRIEKMVSAFYGDEDVEKGMNVRQEVVSEIKRMGKFAYVEISPVLYSNGDVYAT